MPRSSLTAELALQAEGAPATQAWKAKLFGGPTTGNNLADFFTQTSYGKTVLAATDFVGPIDLGSPACCASGSGCTDQDFRLQTVWDYVNGTAGLDLSSYGSTIISWKQEENRKKTLIPALPPPRSSQ